MIIHDNAAEWCMGLYSEGIIELMICPPKTGSILVSSLWEIRTPVPNPCAEANDPGIILIPSYSPSPVPHHIPLIVLLSMFQNLAPFCILTALSPLALLPLAYSTPTGFDPIPGALAGHSIQYSHSDLLKVKPDHVTLTLTSVPSTPLPEPHTENLNVSLLLESRQTPEHIP